MYRLDGSTSPYCRSSTICRTCGFRKRTRRTALSGWRSSSSWLLTCHTCRQFPNSLKARSLPSSACRQIESTSPTRRQARGFGRSGKRTMAPWLNSMCNHFNISWSSARGNRAKISRRWQKPTRHCRPRRKRVSAAVGRSVRLGRYRAVAGGQTRQAIGPDPHRWLCSGPRSGGFVSQHDLVRYAFGL